MEKFRLFDVCVLPSVKRRIALEMSLKPLAVSIEENNKGPASSNVPKKLFSNSWHLNPISHF